MKGSHVRADRTVHLECHCPGTNMCQVAGTFSEWRPVPMRAMGEGTWAVDLPPVKDNELQYKFVDGDRWFRDQVNLLTTPDGNNSLLPLDSRGVVEQRSFHSPALGRTKRYLTYVPARYWQQPRHSFPVLLLMGGLFEDERGWFDKGNVHRVMDRLVEEGLVGPMIILMPDKDDAVFDRGRWESYVRYLSDDVWKALGRIYRTSRLRAAEGLSLGGPWALRLAAREPDAYSSVACLSGYIEEDLADELRGALGALARAGVRFRFACGDDEPEVAANNQWVVGLLQAADVPTEFYLNEGHHDWPLWREQIGHSLRFHWYGFSLRGAKM